MELGVFSLADVNPDSERYRRQPDRRHHRLRKADRTLRPRRFGVGDHRSAPIPASTDPRPPKSEPIRILHVIVDEVSAPKNDGTRGSALYRVPFQLSRSPTRLWRDFFIEAWDHPSSYTTSHRPGIASVEGDRVILNGTTIEEVEKTHRDTLVLALKEANAKLEEADARAFAREERERRSREEHEQKLRDTAKRITFD